MSAVCLAWPDEVEGASAVTAAPAVVSVANAATGAPTVKYLAAAVTAAPATSTPRRAVMDLPNLDHPRVASWIRRFTTDLRGSYATYLSRKPRYEGMISDKLANRGMPQGLIYLAMIESGFNPQARSPVKASGLWQFMSATGKQYGLTVNGRLDERNNPARSTDAALKYLASLHQRLGSWYLAAAAYNSGEGTVTRALMRVTGRNRGTDADYYRISSKLPQETRDYVPKLIAAARIGSDPARYGFSAD
jgi:membrane-bound lytic murein transglycosylase D